MGVARVVKLDKPVALGPVRVAVNHHLQQGGK